jgi:PLP dependent protein
MNIKNNINYLRQNLPASCKLIAVSKTQPVEILQEAYDAGQRVFGENKVQELVDKYEKLPKDIEWHMIGHLQSNKVKYIAPFVHLIHGVDTKKLLEEIDKQGKKIGRKISCLLQVFIAQEETKFGFSENEILDLINTEAISKMTHVQVEGLMGMATFTEKQDQVRDEFRRLRSFFEKLNSQPLPPNMRMKELSTGMSGDYPLAVQEGSTMVRIGTAIFGSRNTTITQ